MSLILYMSGIKTHATYSYPYTPNQNPRHIYNLLYVQVSNNGYFSFGGKPGNTPNSIPTSHSGYVVAPYTAHIEDTTHAGTVQFADLHNYVSSGSAMGNVSDFIQSQTGDSFSGTRMMVAEWCEVPQKNQSTVSYVVTLTTQIIIAMLHLFTCIVHH